MAQFVASVAEEENEVRPGRQKYTLFVWHTRPPPTGGGAGGEDVAFGVVLTLNDHCSVVDVRGNGR
jgi:hypothetical protein